MIFPPVEPWSKYSSTDLLQAVLESRRRHADLTRLAQEGDDAALERWVRGQWPARMAHQDLSFLPRPGRAQSRDVPELLDYALVVHNRRLDEDEDISRVAGNVRALLTTVDVDSLVQGVVYLLDDSSFEIVWRGRLRHSEPVPWRWLVEKGNHRILAQHLIGVGPYAFVRDVHHWE